MSRIECRQRPVVGDSQRYSDAPSKSTAWCDLPIPKGIRERVRVVHGARSTYWSELFRLVELITDLHATES